MISDLIEDLKDVEQKSISAFDPLLSLWLNNVTYCLTIAINNRRILYDVKLHLSVTFYRYFCSSVCLSLSRSVFPMVLTRNSFFFSHSFVMR